MFKLPHQHLGDTWYQTTEDRTHLFFLTCPDSVERHICWSIGHASSTDLTKWDYHGVLFDSDPSDSKRSCLSTGSVTRYGDRYIMSFLCNHNQPNPRLALAESTDLMQWHPLATTHCSLQDSGYSTRGSLAFKNPRWRDPFLFEQSGWLYQLMTAADATRAPDRDGVIAVMRTRDLVHWEFLPPLKTPPIGTDLDCPKLYQVNGKFYLIVSLFNVLQSPHFAALQPPALNPNTSFCLVADRLDGEFHYTGDARILQSDTPGGPYACEAVQWEDEWYLLGTCWSDRLGDSICDPLPLKVMPNGFRGG